MSFRTKQSGAEKAFRSLKSTAKGKKLTANSQIKMPLQSWNDNVLLITICHFKRQHRTANIEQRKTKIKKSTAKGKKLTANSQIKIPLQSWNDNVLLITICHFKSQHRTANIEQRKTKIKKPNKDSSTRSE